MRWERKEVVIRTDLVLLEAVWHVALELSAASASKDEGKAPGLLTGCLPAFGPSLCGYCTSSRVSRPGLLGDLCRVKNKKIFSVAI